MTEHHAIAQAPAPVDSHAPSDSSSRKGAPFDEAALLQRTFLIVAEVAFLLRASIRTVRRLMADPHSGFPKARRIRGRGVFVRDEVLAFARGKAG